jgi:hypothetical protein
MSCELSLFVEGPVGKEGEVAGLVCGTAAGAIATGGFAEGAGEVVCASAMEMAPNSAVTPQKKCLKRLAIMMIGIEECGIV